MAEPETRDLKTAYVVGPISGEPDGNRAAFDEAAEQLAIQGWTVYIPHDHPAAKLALVEAAHLGKGAVGRPAYQTVMRHLLIQLLTEVDAVFALPGWERSNGAPWEVGVAQLVGIPVYAMVDGQVVAYVHLDIGALRVS